MVDAFAFAGQQLYRQLGQLLAAPVLAGDSDPLEMVHAAHAVHRNAEALMATAVQQARTQGVTWQQIGDALGVSRQAAFQRFGKPTDPRTGKPMITSPLPDAAELTGTVIADLAHARWDAISARFDPTMRDRLSEEGLAEGWVHLIGLAGAYEAHGDPEIRRAGDFTTTDTPLDFEAGSFVCRITFRDDRTIAGLYLLDPDAARAGNRHP